MASLNNPFDGEEAAAMYEKRRKKEYPLGDLPLIVLHRQEGGYKPEPGAITPEQLKQLDAERLVHNQDLVQLSRNRAHIIATKTARTIFIWTGRSWLWMRLIRWWMRFGIIIR
jgi:hypothetical protein